MNPAKRFLVVFLLPILALLPLGLVNVLFLDHSGELLDGEAVAKLQQEQPALFGSATHDAPYRYKLALMVERRLEIIVIGSSRVLALRQEMFQAPFANLGRTVNYPAEAVAVVDDILAGHHPQLVLFGLDPWWLNPVWRHAPDFRSHDEVGGARSPGAIMAPLRWLADGRIDLTVFTGRLLDSGSAERDGVALLGIQALMTERGYRDDGSLARGLMLHGVGLAADFGFADTQVRIRSGQAQFQFGDAVDVERLGQLAEAIGRLQDAGIAVVTYVPPVAPTVLTAIADEGRKFAFIDATRAAFSSLGTSHLDAWDATVLGGNDCEFVDGFHHGETLDLRLLLAMSELAPVPLADWLDRVELEHWLALSRGHSQIVPLLGHGTAPESDFLGLGCAGRS
ncbi:MAG: hypothetical protein P8Q36_08955 [Alphaproteobacteria bacterium]|nr:hypothetical protein [Alphaproteobacteria bacterium]